MKNVSKKLLENQLNLYDENSISEDGKTVIFGGSAGRQRRGVGGDVRLSPQDPPLVFCVGYACAPCLAAGAFLPLCGMKAGTDPLSHIFCKTECRADFVQVDKFITIRA